MEQLAQRVLLLSGWRRLILAFALGAASALAQAPFHLFVVLFITLPPLVWLLDGAAGSTPGGRSRALWAAFGIGWWFGLGYFIAGLWWIANALLVEAPEFAWAIPLAVVGLPAFLALFYGTACAFAGIVWSDSVTRLFGIAAAFGLAEWARGFVLTGFPWNGLGYALTPAPIMMQSAMFAGMFAMGAAAVLIFALPALFSAGNRAGLIGSAVAAALMAGHVGFGAWWLMNHSEPVLSETTVRIVQPAIPQGVKLVDTDDDEVFATLLDLTTLPPAEDTDATPDLVIWPETAVPFLLTREPAALAAIGQTLVEGQTLLTGAVREERGEDETARFYNSVLSIDADGTIVAAADKVHLVPFGEYLPLASHLKRFGLQAVAAADRGYSAASAHATVAVGETQLLPLICYEVIFPSYARDAGADPELGAIVNVTNDAWFGRTPGPWQHLHQTRLRAVETGLPVLRVANNGISGVIDPQGRMVARITHDARAVADVSLPIRVQPIVDPLDHNRNFWLFLAFLSAIAILGHVRRPILYRNSNHYD